MGLPTPLSSCLDHLGERSRRQRIGHHGKPGNRQNLPFVNGLQIAVTIALNRSLPLSSRNALATMFTSTIQAIGVRAIGFHRRHAQSIWILNSVPELKGAGVNRRVIRTGLRLATRTAVVERVIKFLDHRCNHLDLSWRDQRRGRERTLS